MIKEIKVPSMGESISSGILASWHVKEGDVVQEGDVLYELETDKITSEGQAEYGGRIQFKVQEGEEVAIGQVIATIDTSVAVAGAGTQKTAPQKEEAKAQRVEPKAKPPVQKEGQEEMSPAVRRIVGETGLKPASVQGTGKGGRVTKGDMLEVLEGKAVGSETVTAKPELKKGGERTTRIKMTPIRKKIAERLVMAQHEAAMLTTFNEVDMSVVMGIRKKYQDEFVQKHGVKLGFMSFFVKAVVHALQQVPAINAQIDGDFIVQNHFYDIGIAVGGARGLVVPVVRHCEELSYAETEKAIINFAQKAKDGKIVMEDMTGGVFTISNGGIYGSVLSTPILNPPQSAILGMHTIKERPVVVDGQIVVRPIMNLALTYDHRIVDGREAVTFLIKVKECIEHPGEIPLKELLGL